MLASFDFQMPTDIPVRGELELPLGPVGTEPRESGSLGVGLHSRGLTRLEVSGQGDPGRVATKWRDAERPAIIGERHEDIAEGQPEVVGKNVGRRQARTAEER